MRRGRCPKVADRFAAPSHHLALLQQIAEVPHGPQRHKWQSDQEHTVALTIIQPSALRVEYTAACEAVDSQCDASPCEKHMRTAAAT